jgi:hypothetical protein
MCPKNGTQKAGGAEFCAACQYGNDLGLQVLFLEQRRGKEVRKADPQALTQFVENAKLHGIIGAVYKVPDGRLGNAAFHIELILRHFALVEQLGQSLADCLIKLHSLTTIFPGTVPVLYGDFI